MFYDVLSTDLEAHQVEVSHENLMAAFAKSASAEDMAVGQATWIPWLTYRREVVRYMELGIQVELLPFLFAIDTMTPTYSLHIAHHASPIARYSLIPTLQITATSKHEIETHSTQSIE